MGMMGPPVRGDGRVADCNLQHHVHLLSDAVLLKQRHRMSLCQLAVVQVHTCMRQETLVILGCVRVSNYKEGGQGQGQMQRYQQPAHVWPVC